MTTTPPPAPAPRMTVEEARRRLRVSTRRYDGSDPIWEATVHGELDYATEPDCDTEQQDGF